MKKKNILILIFSIVSLILILENPLISQIDIFYSYVSISSTQPQTNDGLFIQGSVIVSQVTLTYVNSTNYQPLGYKITISIFNFGSLMVLFIPLVVYLYLSSGNSVKKTIKVKEKKTNGI
jgi:hypothetical protein